MKIGDLVRFSGPVSAAMKEDSGTVWLVATISQDGNLGLWNAELTPGRIRWCGLASHFSQYLEVISGNR